MITFKPLVGADINDSCKEAVAMAINGNCDVSFSFNGVEIVATPESVPSELSKQFYKTMQDSADAYRNSDAGKAEAAKKKSEVEELQKECDAMVLHLPAILQDGHSALMPWLARFSEVSDRIGVNMDSGKIADELEDAGYKNNMHVGQKPEWFSTKPRMAEYIAGQAVNCLRNGMPPHQITLSFVKQYEALP